MFPFTHSLISAGMLSFPHPSPFLSHFLLFALLSVLIIYCIPMIFLFLFPYILSIHILSWLQYIQLLLLTPSFLSCPLILTNIIFLKCISYISCAPSFFLSLSFHTFSHAYHLSFLLPSSIFFPSTFPSSLPFPSQFFQYLPLIILPSFSSASFNYTLL